MNLSVRLAGTTVSILRWPVTTLSSQMDKSCMLQHSEQKEVAHCRTATQATGTTGHSLLLEISTSMGYSAQLCLEFLIGVRHMRISAFRIQYIVGGCCGIGFMKMTTAMECWRKVGRAVWDYRGY